MASSCFLARPCLTATSDYCVAAIYRELACNESHICNQLLCTYALVFSFAAKGGKVMKRGYWNAAVKSCVTALAMGLLTPQGAMANEDEIILDPIERAANAISLDAGFATLNRLIPSFGGLYKSEKGEVVVALTDPSIEKTARPIIAAYLTARAKAQGIAADNALVIFQPAKHTWAQILDYRDKLVDVMALPDAVFLDADEACNCVTIGVANADAALSVEEYVVKSGVPSAVVRIVERAPYEFYQSLTDAFRPFKGGIQIAYWPTSLPGAPPEGWSWFRECTVMAVARQTLAVGFVTNSHCTNAGTAGVPGTLFHQPHPIFFPASATDLVNPPWTPSLPNCPAGRLCRFSDSAFAFSDPADARDLGKIALPIRNCGTPPCGPGMGHPTDELVVDRIGPAPLVGMAVNKIGRTTGFTSGRVTASCVMFSVFRTTQTSLCQDDADVFSSLGDSGSPVFVELGAGRVALVGILWGGNHLLALGTPPRMGYSPIGAVQAELGPLNLVAAPVTVPPPQRKSYCERYRDLCLGEASTSQDVGLCKTEFRACKQSGIP